MKVIWSILLKGTVLKIKCRTLGWWWPVRTSSPTRRSTSRSRQQLQGSRKGTTETRCNTELQTLLGQVNRWMQVTVVMGPLLRASPLIHCIVYLIKGQSNIQNTNIGLSESHIKQVPFQSKMDICKLSLQTYLTGFTSL